MNFSDPPHAGIELDRIDFFLNHPAVGESKTDYKAFIKTLSGNIMKNSSFSTFSNQIREINRILKMKYSSANDIADVILKDMALTTKLLKLVNSSFYGQFSDKGISTISEAMIILGTEEIKLAAAGLKIYEIMNDAAKVRILKDKAIKSFQRSIIAGELALEEKMENAEYIQITAILYDFGEYLVALFSPEVYLNVEMAVDEKQLSREQASKCIIGISYSQIGRFFASRWHLPQPIISAMKPVSNFNLLKNRLNTGEIQRYICSLSNELCDIDFSLPGGTIGKKIHEISEKYKTCLGITPSKSLDLLKMSSNKITKHASILKMSRAGMNQCPI